MKIKSRVRFTLSLITALVVCIGCQKNTPALQSPASHDPRLSLKLIAVDPQIMTPIGLTIDEQDQIFVLESHTHSPESDYSGPAFDKIKRASDFDENGMITNWAIYADGIEDGMNIMAYRSHIFLVTKNMVLNFQDTKKHGVSDVRDTLVVMDPPEKVYDHAGLLGIEISADGWMYISRGNIGGQRYKITGSDGSTLQNFGNGGNVYRCRLDGSALEEVATGFWNPFGLEISKKGHLWLTDNDPDSRGPNRLVKLVMGANFGYQSLYGGSGIHPFNAWNGELPGTLPYYAGIGEAPCGMIDASFSNLPLQYNDHMLVAIWEENKIISIPLNHNIGDNINTETFIQGDSTFHPVAFATNARGDIYFTDWVVRQYPNHGKGKIWKIEVSGKSEIGENNKMQTVNIWRNLKKDISNDSLIQVLMGNDEEQKTVARSILSHPDRQALLSSLLHSQQSSLRLQALLASFHIHQPISVKKLSLLLEDHDPQIRKTAMIYIAKKSRKDLEEKVLEILENNNHDAESFGIFLETVRHLQPVFIKAFSQAKSRSDSGLTQTVSDDFIFEIFANGDLSHSIRGIALKHLKNPAQKLDELINFLHLEKNLIVRESIIDAVKKVESEQLVLSLLDILTDEREEEAIRIKSLNALAFQAGHHCHEITNLLNNSSAEISEAVIRHLCGCRSDAVINERVENFITTYNGANKKNMSDIWSICQGIYTDQPKSEKSWLDLLNQPGNAVKGKTIFEARRYQCQTCHAIDSWGGHFGPDLSHIGSSKSPTQLAEAILNPSAEIAPEWQGWIVTDSSGTPHLGWQIDVGRHDVELMNQAGEFITYRSPQKYALADASLMPEHLERQLTSQDFRDLVAYLVSLK